MMWQEAVAELFCEGAEMVVVFAPEGGEEGDLIARSVILDGLRERAGEADIEKAAEVVGENYLQTYLALSAIDAVGWPASASERRRP